MWVITYKGKPTDISRLAALDKLPHAWISSTSGRELEAYITGSTKRVCIKHFLHYFGYTWREREKGIECQKARIL